MDVNKYVNSEQYASVIETDRGLTINGTFIPYVVQNSVKCNDMFYATLIPTPRQSMSFCAIIHIKNNHHRHYKVIRLEYYCLF